MDRGETSTLDIKMRSVVFRKTIHNALWGSESWEISAHPSDPSVIDGGERKGATLREEYPNFPLLFKVIDAKTRLSVQVHPNEKTCKVTGGEPKTEMWCALSDGPIYAGLREGTTAADVEAAVKSGKFEDLLVRHEAKFGDVFFIPGGLVHAIGDGVKLYEVQQSSNTTFRLYDWGRVGTDGKPRELHIEKGLQAIDYALPVPVPCKSLDTPFFKFSQERVLGASILSTRVDEFLALYTAKDEIDLDGKRVMERTSVLIPPSSTCELFGSDSILFLTRFKGEGCTT